MVHQLKSHKASVHTHRCDKQLKGYLWEAYPYKYTTYPNLPHWEKLVMLVQHMWYHSNLPT